MNIKTILSSSLAFIFLGLISLFTLFALSKSHRIKTSNSVYNSSELNSKRGPSNQNAAYIITNLRQSSVIQATNLSPTNGPINSIVKISIYGIGFSLFPKLFVHFDVTEGPYEVVPASAISDTLLEVDTPSGLSYGESGKSVLVSIHSHPDIMLQSSNALIFRFYEVPIISLISPNHTGMSGGSEIKIFGTGLFASDDLKCLFQSKERSKIVDATYSMSTFDISTMKNFLHENYNKNTLESALITQLNKNLPDTEIKTIIDNILNHNPMPSIICECPSWTVSEKVSLSISFNGVQYHICTDGFTFEEESSLFGNVAHVVKERDTPSEIVSEDEIELKNLQYRTNNSKIISSEIVLKNVNSKSNSHYITHNHQINDLHKYTDNSGNTYTLSNSSNASLLHSDYGLFLEIVILFYSSFIFGTVCKFIGLPLLLGYIIGGYIVGPSGFGYISQPIQIISIAQIGVCLILFTLGLEFSIKRVLSIGKSVIYCAVSSMLFFVCLCSAYSILIGTPINEGIFIGSFISMSSTAVVICELQIESNESMLTVGILILQDLLLGILLALIPALQITSIDNVSPRASNTNDFSNEFNQSKIHRIPILFVYFCLFLWKIIKPFIILMIFFLISFVVKTIIFPVILFILTKTKSREIILIGIISIVLCISSFTEYLGLSMEMGSFVGGVILSSLFNEEDTNNFKQDFIQSTESLKWIFSMLFFTSIGLVIDATFIWDNYWTIGYVCLLISLIKLFVNFLIFFTFGHSVKLSAFTSLMLANLGEFGFVLASKGISLGIISRKVYLILVATTVISLLSTPIILRIFSIILKRKVLNIPLNENNYKRFNAKNNGIVSVRRKFNFSIGNSIHNINKRKVFNITNIIKNLSIFNRNNHSLDSPKKDYKFDIYIQNNYLNSRFQDDRILHSNILQNARTNPNFDFSLNENELEDLSQDKVANESNFAYETSSISLEKIDEFTLAHVTNLGNSSSKM
ncbi:K+ H+ antiporter [Cryptosporidium ubiquitum]|uniref:K+ H+ antiporter n=1 Tax=Cryptosporidium ubiquitum TaxID=857276 RepID=A0A1J4MNR2_9CRYT|nr:K+ H+ antiporter [Cryptosporidium ubiquitum]OII74660.1 K+ H+ antiporter [Cryptosporidium ubiquitum]